MATVVLLLVAAAGLAFFLWSPAWLGPPAPEAAPLRRPPPQGERAPEEAP